MRELIYNLQPTIYVLIATIVLLVRPLRINKEKSRAFLKSPHWRIRAALGVVMILAICFVASSLLMPRPGFIVINTICSFLLLSLYLVKLYVGIWKAVKS